MSADPIGAASTTLAAPCARATRQAARAVDPVANPSSTISTTRPCNGTLRPSAAVALDPALQLGPLGGLHLRDVGVADQDMLQDVLVEDAHPALPDGAERQLGLGGHAELAHDEYVQRRAERLGDLVGDRHPAARQAEDHHVLPAVVQQPLGQPAARVGAVGVTLHTGKYPTPSAA